MSLVPKHIQELKPYVAGKSKKEFKRKFGNKDSIKLASNENPLGCSPQSIQRVQNHIKSCNRYPDSSGFELRQKLSDIHDLDINNVIIGSGSEGIMSNVMRTFLSNDDKIISSMNSFIGFRVLADASGYHADWVPMKDYHYDLDGIADKIDNKTKIIYLANPDNPTGTYFTKNEFDSFMEKVPDRVLIILDEAYYEYTEGLDDYPDSMIYRYDNIITLRTFSKVYGLAGFRVGYGFAHENLIMNLMKVKLPFEPATLSQEAALAALNDECFMRDSIVLNMDEKNLMYSFFDDNDISYIKSATNFITLVFDDEVSNYAFCDSFLEEGVILRNLKAFGLGHCTRVTIGNSDENKIFKEAFSKVIDRISI